MFSPKHNCIVTIKFMGVQINEYEAVYVNMRRKSFALVAMSVIAAALMSSIIPSGSFESMLKKMRVLRTMAQRRTNRARMDLITRKKTMTPGLKMTTTEVKMIMITMRAPDLKMMMTVMMTVMMRMGMRAIAARQEQNKRVNRRTCAADGQCVLM